MTGPESAPPRRRRGNPLYVVGLLVFAMAVYFALIGYRGVYLITQEQWTLKVLGAAVLVLPLLGIWVVVAEIRFGMASEHLARRLAAAGESTELPELPRLPSGRPDRKAADGWFDEQRTVVEQAPDDWRGWFRLAQAYDLAGDRKRARSALRTAISKAG